MNVRSTEGVTIMEQCWINYKLFLSLVQKVSKVGEVTVKPPHSVPSTVLIKYKHLGGTEPTLQQKTGQCSYNIKITVMFIAGVYQFMFSQTWKLKLQNPKTSKHSNIL